jgi:hypothetical protein
MTDNEVMIRREFEVLYNKQDQANISKADCMLRSSQVFEKDGVHLTKNTGVTFVENLLSMAEDNFEAEVINIGDNDLTEKIEALANSWTSKAESGTVAVNELKRSMTICVNGEPTSQSTSTHGSETTT